MGQRSTTAEWPSTVRINNSKTSEEGFYLDMTICCKHISMLVNTGASVTILSQKFLKTINPSSMPKITPVKLNMMTATGEISPFIGEFEAYLKLGKNLIKHKVLVADMPTEGILGMDFLTKNECDVLLSKSCIRYRGQERPCFK